MRSFDLLLDIQVYHAVDGRDIFLDLVTQHEHAVEVVAEELDGDAGLCTREHGVDTVRDGLPDFDVDTGQNREFLAHIGYHLGMRAVFQFEGGFDFRGVHTQRVLVELGTSRLAGHGLDFGNLEQQLLGPATDVVRLLERDARQGTYVDGERPFVERRQEAAAQGKEGNQCRYKEYDGAAQYLAAVAQRPLEGPLVILLERAGHNGFAAHLAVVAFLAQQVAAEHRREGKGHDGRSKQRHDEGDTQRYQHAPLHTGEEEERNEGDDNDERRVKNRHTYLARSFEHYVDNRLTLAGR